jgi:cytochrome c
LFVRWFRCCLPRVASSSQVVALNGYGVGYGVSTIPPAILSKQEAVDVAEFVTHQPRPSYAPAKNDYARGNKPKDARN